MKFILLTATLLLFLSACGSSSEEKSGGSGLAPTTNASYEMIEGCTTGVKQINGNNKDEVISAMCEMLKNNDQNGNCASHQRQQLYKALSCPGAWPHPQATGMNISTIKTYELANESCSAGIHYISSSNFELGDKAYCNSLMDDARNKNCARSEREKKFREAGCKTE